MDIRQYLIDARTKAGLSESQLAKAAGVHRSAIQHVESGRRLPTPAYVKRMVGPLGLDLGAVMDLACKAEIEQEHESIEFKWM